MTGPHIDVAGMKGLIICKSPNAESQQ